MSEYTAEDFARATLATRGAGDVARRIDDYNIPWRAYTHDGGAAWQSDAEMAAGGWVPVLVESRVTEHTLRDPQEKAARKRQRLVDHIADQDRVIRRRNDEITALRLELADAQAPLSLDSLAAAWEAAEQAGECREGDVLIIRDDEDNYLVRRMDDRSRLDSTARILSRAPKPREPWQDLADVIGEHTYEPDPKWLAQALYQSGVRVTDGGE